MLPTLAHKRHGDNMARTILHMKLDAELKEELRKLAEKENRTLSNLIEKVLKDYAEQNRGR